MKKGVILLSGGIDSAVTLYIAKKKGYSLTALIFNYNQKHKKEIKSAKKLAEINKVKYIILDLYMPWTKSALTEPSVKIPENRVLTGVLPATYVEGRNIIFLSCAASLAESVNADRIFIGAHIEDYSGYPDCRPDFLNAFNRAINKGLRRKKIRIAAPLLYKSKKSIIKKGLQLHVPFQHTWSCYNGKSIPCGVCDSCHFREKAFTGLKIKDPLLS